MGFFIWVEQTGLSIWIRETPSLWGFPFILYLHTLGLALLVGISTALCLWLLTAADRYPVAPLKRFMPFMWAGFAINAVSGLLLLIAYPAKALTNPVFYVKLSAVFIAFTLLQWVDRTVFGTRDAGQVFMPSPKVTRASLSIIGLWLLATGTGRFLAYTHSILMASEANFY
jgi:hypothetical protein